jgi:hypothetical protein
MDILEIGHFGLRASYEIDRDDDCAPDDAEYGKHVPTHFGKPQEEYGVETDLIDQLLLFGLCDGLDPIREALANRRRRVLGVGMAELWSICNGVVGSNQREGDCDKDREADRKAKG